MYSIKTSWEVIQMFFLNVMTSILFHITAWVVLLVILIPFAYLLWMLAKDILEHDGQKLKHLFRFFTNDDSSEEPHKKEKNPSEKLKVLAPESVSMDPEGLGEEPRPLRAEEQKERKHELPSEDKGEGVIYLDKKTSLTAEVPEDKVWAEKEKLD